MPIIISGGRPTCPGSSGRCSRASSAPTSRSGATIRSRNISTTSPAPASTRSVYVQTNWANDRFEDEAAWVQRDREGTGWPHAIVAYADFSVDDVRPQLDRLARYPLVRGVRMQLHWHENPLYRFAARPDLCADPTIRRNVAPARRLWLELRPAGVRAADGRRRRARRSLSRRHFHPAARRHAGRPLARRAAPPGAPA